MKADERLTLLKKAYAEIILNTAKEAAARILVSERKALRFQHELFAAKEESLQMLLRLKRVMDSKTSEAEMASFSQQKTIEELELQLQEAEDIVKDLREELREVQDELYRTAKKEAAHLNHGTVNPQETSVDNQLDVSHSTTLPPPDFESAPISVPDFGNLSQENEGQKLFNSFLRMGNSYVSNSELPSIILRSKEPELYRNGCTQRVRACERTPLDRELSFSDKVNDEKHDSDIKEEGGEKVRKAPVCEPDDKCDREKNDVVQGDGMVSNWQQVRVVKSIRKKRKRSTRFTKIRNPSCRYQPDEINKINRAAGVSCLKICGSGKDIGASGEKDTFASVQRVSSDRNGQGMEHVSSDTKIDAANAGNGFQLVRDEFVSTRQDRNECTERSEAATDQKNIGKVDLPLVTSESKSKASDTTRVIPLHPVNDRVIKYTFQRKRKRETLNSSEGNMRENLKSDEGSAASVGKQDVGKQENVLWSLKSVT